MRSRTSASLAEIPSRAASASDASSWIICWTIRWSMPSCLSSRSSTFAPYDCRYCCICCW
jgi:hypothetical protein